MKTCLTFQCDNEREDGAYCNDCTHKWQQWGVRIRETLAEMIWVYSEKYPDIDFGFFAQKEG
jgi:hypothetical protein